MCNINLGAYKKTYMVSILCKKTCVCDMSVYVIYVACIITILYYIALDHIVLYYAVLLSFFAIT